MRKLIALTSILLLFYVFSGVSTTGETPALSLHQATADECTTATATISLIAGPGGGSDLSFDKSSISVAQGDCVELTLENQGALPHDFTVDAGDGFNALYLPVNAGETATLKFLAPEADVTVEFYCSVPGHKDGGMFGELIVGAGSSDNGDDGDSPGFGLYLAFLGIAALAVTVRKRN